MTADERALMGQHAAYFADLFANGKVLVYGPVMASAGAFGMAVLEVADQAEAQSICESDPTIQAGLNNFAVSPMQVAAARARA
jgi:uncharacterized protein YciI